jgi:hypothetical protein
MLALPRRIESRASQGKSSRLLDREGSRRRNHLRRNPTIQTVIARLMMRLCPMPRGRSTRGATSSGTGPISKVFCDLPTIKPVCLLRQDVVFLNFSQLVSRRTSQRYTRKQFDAYTVIKSKVSQMELAGCVSTSFLTQFLLG